MSRCPDDNSTLLVDPNVELIGSIVDDRYEILSFVGAGGWSTVYKARHRGLDKLVAIKVLHDHLAVSTDKFLRFQQEARTQSKFSHPNVVGVFDFGRLPSGNPYLAMEYVEGCALNQLLYKCGALPAASVVEISRQIASALQAAHRQGVIHRDLKPQNIIIADAAAHGANPFASALEESQDLGRVQMMESGIVKVLDFGLSKLIHEGDTANNITRSGTTVGTPAYMSPEQCLAQPIDGRSDIYALGCVMYEMLTGRQAVDGATIYECMDAHLKKTPSPLNHASSDNPIPPRLEQIIFKALEKKPASRYQTAGELLRALETLGPAPERKKRRLFHPSFGRLWRGTRRGRMRLLVVVVLILSVGVAAALIAKMPDLSSDSLLPGGSPEACNRLVAEAVQRGDYQQAKALLAKAVSYVDKHIGVVSPQKAFLKIMLGQVYLREGKIDAAERELVEARSIVRQVTGPVSRETASAEFELGKFYLTYGKPERAEPHLNKARSLCQQILGNDGPEQIAVLNLLIELKSKQKATTDELALLERLIAIQEHNSGFSSPELIDTLERYQAALQAAKRLPEAKKVQARVKALRGSGGAMPSPGLLR